MTSHAKTFRTVSHFKTDSRSPAGHLPFELTGMPFERLVLSVLKKFIIRSNGSGYPFKKTHQPFERLKLSVRKKSSAARTARAIRSRNSSAIRMAQAIRSRNSSAVPMAQAIHLRNSSAVWMAQAIRSRNSSAVQTARAVRARKKQWVFWAAVPTRPDFKTNRHALPVMITLHKQSSRFCSLFIFV